MRVLFWGTPEFALPTLRALSEEGHYVVGVVTQPDRPRGRGRSLVASPIKRAALEEGIPVVQPERARGPELRAELERLAPEISVVVAYGQILPSDILAVPALGSVNVHASLLPELRGAAPIQWAIIRGDQTSGVTIMRMEAGLDSGPILHQVPEPIRADETAGELALRLAELGAEALVEVLAGLPSGSVPEMLQDPTRATFAPKLQRDDARVDWKLPAAEIARWIRGTDPAPGAWAPLGDAGAVKLFRPRPDGQSRTHGAAGEVLRVDPQAGFLVAAGEGALWIGEVQPAGKRRMTAAEWVRGRSVATGDRFG